MAFLKLQISFFKTLKLTNVKQGQPCMSVSEVGANTYINLCG